MDISVIVLDLIMLAFFVLMVVSGYKKGFLKGIVQAVGMIASLIAAIWLSQSLAEILFTEVVRPYVLDSVGTAIQDTGSATVTDALPAILAALPAFVLNPIVAQYGSQENMLNEIQKAVDSSSATLGESITDTVIAPIVTLLLQLLLCLLIFIICVIIVKILAKLLGGIRKIPLIGSVNAGLGAVVGAAEGIVLLLLLGLIGHIVIALSGDSITWFNSSTVQSGYIYPFFYQFF